MFVINHHLKSAQAFISDCGFVKKKENFSKKTL